MKRGIGVCIPSIPPRRELLQRAISSVTNQILPVELISVAFDVLHEGAWATRNRAVSNLVNAEWVVFLDDDDELMPHFTRRLYDAALETGADMVWGWYDVIGGSDPFPHYRGRQYNIEQPHIVPITYMVRTEYVLEALHSMGGFQADVVGAWDVQDMPLINYMVKGGAKLHAIEDTVWRWYHHGGNTSGMPGRWT
jgi:glycosyltransferase involved in cell wall biosynthesis